MLGKKHIYRIKLAFSLSNINADFLQLILCMFVSHYIMGNPLFGAALFLFTNIWTLFFLGNLRNIKFGKNDALSFAIWLLLAASVLAALALMFIYPSVVNSLKVNNVSFFVLIVTARSLITYWVNKTYSQKRWQNRLYKVLFQLLFIIPCVAYALSFMEGVAVYGTIAGFVVTGFLLSYQSSTLVSFGKYVKNIGKDKMGGIFSYRMFSNMTFYSQIAFSIGVTMYICYISFYAHLLAPYTYLILATWLITMLISQEVFTWFVHKRGWVLSLNLFIIGVALWIYGSIRAYGATDVSGSWFWTMVWGFGLACITSVTNRYNSDLKMVARLVGKKVSDRDLHFRNLLTQIISVIISNAIMLCIITVWTFVIPSFTDTEVPSSFRRLMIQLPIIFMLVSAFYALKQPLDKRSLQKLINYSKGINQNEQTRANLNARLVKKNRVRFGVKIIAAITRPFLRLKVSGEEQMSFSEFPSIFVCNHGVLYGPVAAVIYLPTYFRPWVDRKMVYRDLCEQEMFYNFFRRVRFLPAGVKRWLCRMLARPVTWAIGSFNPIPVEKNSLRNVMSTFEDTVKVLAEGDNVLIFPEKPKNIKVGKKVDATKHETNTVGRLYTGFASIGKLYYDLKGKELRFYPVYANKKSRTFKVGEPIVFDPNNDPREEKQRIAEELQERMLKLK